MKDVAFAIFAGLALIALALYKRPVSERFRNVPVDARAIIDTTNGTISYFAVSGAYEMNFSEMAANERKIAELKVKVLENSLKDSSGSSK